MIETTAVLSSKRQLTLPAHMARALQLGPGSRLIVRLEDDRIVLLPIGSGRLTDALAGVLEGAYGDVETYIREERASWGDA
ncbi:MAG: AbrB/MazE/SpoVT family DNA-binding domain-containing protein [Ardenticatenales bacterium]|nr:AbrB/MazE/SpoVT family DNA-binding domain-containing protein [Ardenticatenales bacterium]